MENKHSKIEFTPFSVQDRTLIKDIHQKMERFIAFLEKGEPIIGEKKWVPEAEARKLLGRKSTTLWKLRISGKLTFSKIGNRVYYSMDSINQLLESNQQEAYHDKFLNP